MNEFLQRLKQRKLVQWAVAYVAAAFALLQGIDIVAQRFGWPEQTMRLVIIALSRRLLRHAGPGLVSRRTRRAASQWDGASHHRSGAGLGGGFLWRFAGSIALAR